MNRNPVHITNFAPFAFPQTGAWDKHHGFLENIIALNVSRIRSEEHIDGWFEKAGLTEGDRDMKLARQAGTFQYLVNHLEIFADNKIPGTYVRDDPTFAEAMKVKLAATFTDCAQRCDNMVIDRERTFCRLAIRDLKEQPKQIAAAIRQAAFSDKQTFNRAIDEMVETIDRADRFNWDRVNAADTNYKLGTLMNKWFGEDRIMAFQVARFVKWTRGGGASAPTPPKKAKAPVPTAAPVVSLDTALASLEVTTKPMSLPDLISIGMGRPHPDASPAIKATMTVPGGTKLAATYPATTHIQLAPAEFADHVNPLPIKKLTETPVRLDPNNSPGFRLTLEPGATVRLLNDPRKLTVESIQGNSVVCRYSANGKVEHQTFDSAKLWVTDAANPKKGDLEPFSTDMDGDLPTEQWAGNIQPVRRTDTKTAKLGEGYATPDAYVEDGLSKLAANYTAILVKEGLTTNGNVPFPAIMAGPVFFQDGRFLYDLQHDRGQRSKEPLLLEVLHWSNPQRKEFERHLEAFDVAFKDYIAKHSTAHSKTNLARAIFSFLAQKAAD